MWWKRTQKRVGAGGSVGQCVSEGKPVSQILIRWMIRSDMPAVLEIESESFDFAWTHEDFRRALSQRNCIGMVAEIDNQVVGFMIYALGKSKLEIINFAVDPVFRNQGVGSTMLNKLLGKLNPERRRKLVLAIRDSNLPAHLFFSRHGFTATKIIPDFYPDCVDDAYWFEYDSRAQPGVAVPTG